MLKILSLKMKELLATSHEENAEKTYRVYNIFKAATIVAG
jgi:hypothetical protein